MQKTSFNTEKKPRGKIRKTRSMCAETWNKNIVSENNEYD